MMKPTRRWKYRNVTLLLASLVVLFFLADSDIVHALIGHIEKLGYLGAVLTGVFFVSTFTVAPASVVLFHLAQDLGALPIALCAGAGAVAGDLLLFRFLKDGVFEEIKPLLSRFGGSYLAALLRTPYFIWFAPVFGAIIIASPFPDEIGIGLMGLSKIKLWQFAGLAFVLNAAGIFAVVVLAHSL